MSENTRSSELSEVLWRIGAFDLLNHDQIVELQRWHASKVEEAYRKGYAAGNAKKNYHKKSDSNQAVDGLEIRVSALEYRLALQSKEEKDKQ